MEEMRTLSKLFRSSIALLTGFLFSLYLGFAPEIHAAGETPGSYVSIPPFIAQSTDKPNVIISLDTSGSMKVPAYRQLGKKWDQDVHDNFDPAHVYYGYFDPNKFYLYDTNSAKQFFVEDPSTVKTDFNWNGNFLNWLAMRRFDVARRVLIGGKVRDRDTESIGGSNWYVLQGQNEPGDRQFSKSYVSSSAYTPIEYADGTIFQIANGQIEPLGTSGSTNSKSVVLQDDNGAAVEIGFITMDWTVGDPWAQITFEHPFSVAPAVVAKPLTYEGGDPTITRVRNVTSTGFEIRIQEWDYRDGNHITESLFFMAADAGAYDLTVNDNSGNDVDIKVEAGSIAAVTSMCEVFANKNIGPFVETPIVFTGVSTFNDAAAVTTRNHNVSTSSFDYCMEEEEAADNIHAGEDVHYIVMAPETGATFPIAGVTDSTKTPVEVGQIFNVNNAWKTHTFTNPFGGQPSIVADIQTVNGPDTVSVRIANAKWSATEFDIQLDEEQSLDSETSHVNENIGYIAASGKEHINIHLGILESDLTNKPNMPRGLIHSLGGSMNLGVAVFNYDRTKNPTSVYNAGGNDFDGGTFNPCYPDVEKPASDRTNWDICKETYVGAPIDDLIDVIEDHPLVWATTPIAETLYNIGQYVAQKQGPSPYADLNTDPWPHSEIRQGSPTAPATQNGNAVPAGNVGAHPPYEVNNTWDPYYNDAIGQKLPCAKTFVLHFNDGEPYTDWDAVDNNGNPLFPIPNDITAISGYTSGNPFDKNDGLDEVAHRFRNKDMRNDLTGHQEVISYYILAALGENMSDIPNSALNRLMRAAAMGGFNDRNNDHEPDDKSVTDFVNYINTNSGSCSVNEWDEDGDCVPDTFYFANDGFALETELLAAFQSILKRVASGGAASVLSGTASGQGAVFEARFEQERATANFSARWIGDVSGTFVDSFGFLREDGDQDNILDVVDFSQDGIITMCEDTTDQVVRVNVASSISTLPTASEIAACTSTKFNKSLFDIKRVWSAAEEMSKLTDPQVANQRTYSTLTGRHIITGIDGSDATALDGIVTASEQQAFVTSSFSGREGLLDSVNSTEATKIVDFTRGHSAVAGLRSRNTLDGSGNLITWRLGDIIHSSPISVGRPAENYDLIYANVPNLATYGEFFQAYKDRRSVILAGGNDGMMHAFNAGYFNPTTLQYEKGKTGTTQHNLGSELWAYIPYNVLPHLKYVSDLSYGSKDGDHIYMVDAVPRVFDARIFNDSATGYSGGIDGQASVSHPKGWGTILVGGMRFGGGPVEVDIDNDGNVDQTLRSSFFILDITDPEKPPKLLLEYTSAELGFTSAIPAPVIKNDGSGVDKWYLMLGSGPHNSASPGTAIRDGTSDQYAKLFMLNLNTMQLESSFGTSGVLTMDAAADAGNAFVSALYPVDYDLDSQTDAVYISTVNGSPGNFAGKLYRLTLRDSDGLGVINSGSYRNISAWTSDIIVDNSGPITSISNAGVDSNGNRWVYFGTGRFLVRADAADNSQQSFYGVKEPRSNNGGFTWAAVDSTKIVDVSDIVVKTDGKLYKNATATTLNTLSTAGSVNDFVALSTAMAHAPSSSFTANAGWKRDFGESPHSVLERNVGQALLIGGVLAYTGFEPSGNICEYKGSTVLYAVNFTTGTANSNVFSLGDPDTSSGPVEVTDSVYIGKGLSATLSLHIGNGYQQNNSLANNKGTAFLETSNALLSSQSITTSGAIMSGETNWRTK